MLAENPDVGWSASQIDLPLRSAPAGRSEKLTQREQVFSNKKPNKRGMKDLVTDVLMFVLNAPLCLADRESDR